MSRYHSRINRSPLKAACSPILMYLTRFSCSRWRGRNVLSHQRCRNVSLLLSFVLLCVNIYVWVNGCENFQRPVHLPHGYLPVFPHHLYPSNHSVLSSLSSSSSSGLDHFLNSHVSFDSLNNRVPPVLHIIHCDIGPFTFPHYLSVLAAFKILKPSTVYLHTRREPELDPDGYFQFLPDLMRDIPILTKVVLKEPHACSSKGNDQAVAYFKLIGLQGGVAVNSRTILSPSQSLLFMLNRKRTIVNFDVDTRVLIVSLTAQLYPSLQKLVDSVYTSASSESDSVVLKCDTPASFSFRMNKSNLCIYQEEDLFPIQIVNAKSDFASLARWVGYGTSDLLILQPSDDEVVPNIVHYVWLGKRKLDYFTYLSFLSSLHVLKADAVYVHGEAPLGDLWTYFEKEPRLKLIRRDFPESVYGIPIKKFISHASDYLRADILLRYGGVYADTDVIFLQQIPPNIRRYNTSACVDWPETGAFPDVFNMGVLAAAPGSTYLRYFLESYRWYLDGDWSYNAIHIPYKVYEKKPQTLNIARHLQVLCAEDKCHAPWVGDYKVDGVDHLDGKTFDWQKDAFAIHWTHPDPKEFTSHKALLSIDSITADIGKMVLRKAKLLNI